MFDFTTPDLITIPENVPLLGGMNAIEASAQVEVEVHGKLDPSEAPIVKGRAEIDTVVLGESIYGPYDGPFLYPGNRQPHSTGCRPLRHRGTSAGIQRGPRRNSLGRVSTIAFQQAAAALVATDARQQLVSTFRNKVRAQ